ncbi:MAG TPA: hypothetical protein VF007_10055 [Stellaceae bacterium]
MAGFRIFYLTIRIYYDTNAQAAQSGLMEVPRAGLVPGIWVLAVKPSAKVKAGDEPGHRRFGSVAELSLIRPLLCCKNIADKLLLLRCSAAVIRLFLAAVFNGRSKQHQ